MNQEVTGVTEIRPLPKVHNVELRSSCLSYTEILAQSVSVIAPSTVPAAVLGLIYAKAGNATWVSFLLGCLGLVLVSLNINQFARRSASPGSLYSYIVQGLGPTAGILGGWALLFGYTLTGMSTLCGFALIANVLLDQMFGVQLPVLIWFAAGVLVSFYIAFRDIQLSAKAMFWFEGASLLGVAALCYMIWSNHGFSLDTAQLTMKDASPSKALAGVVLVVFCFSGFESATGLGHEASKPHKNIPRAVIQSVVISGLFFIVTAFVIVMGFGQSQGALGNLASNEAPLHALASAMGKGGLGTLINIGILLSFFSCTLAAINSSARIIYAMARHGLIPDALGQAHLSNRTPHVAVGLTALLTFGIPCALYVCGVSAFEGQEYFATLCSFGFIVVYILISLAAPVYLASIGRLTVRSVFYAIGGVGFMALPLAATIGVPGSEIFPVTDAAGSHFMAIFAAYMAVGLSWLVLQRMRRPKMIDQMQHAVARMDLKRAQVEARDLEVVPTLESKVI